MFSVSLAPFQDFMSYQHVVFHGDQEEINGEADRPMRVT
jgi:hypothetical protein